MIDYSMLKNRFFWIISAIMVVGFLILLSYKERGMEISPSFQTSTMQKLYLTHREDNKVEWELSAREAMFPPGRREVFLKFISLTINQSPKIYITSGSGIYRVEEGDFILNKTVELNMEDTKFMTNTLKWDSKGHLITTDDPVRLTGKNFSIDGTGLIAKTEQQKARILKNVKAIYYQ